jgi:hypothetical protein
VRPNKIFTDPTTKLSEIKERKARLSGRHVLNLYAIEGFSHKEIASILEIEEGTSRSQYSRAKIMLENILIKRGVIDQSFKKTKNTVAI